MEENMLGKMLAAWWLHWRKPTGIAHLICCGGLLIWAAAFWSGFALIGGAFLQPAAYAVGLLLLGAGIWLAALFASRRLRAGGMAKASPGESARGD